MKATFNRTSFPEEDYYDEQYSDQVQGNSTMLGITKHDIRQMIPQIMAGSLQNLSVSLSEWQKSQLKNLEERGVECLLTMWFRHQRNSENGTYCNATWDNVSCWPPTPGGETITRQCSDVLQNTNTRQPTSYLFPGNAFRVCLENGTWLWGNWTNYDQCADSYEEYERRVKEEKDLVVAVQHILFIGSILSVVSLVAAIAIFGFFRCLWCDRVKMHMHLMVALLLRCIFLIIITEPFIFHRTRHYRNVDFICKAVLSISMYATVASVNWMFLQGVYLHGRLTTNVFDRGTPFKGYYAFGWIFPLVLMAIFVVTLEIYHPVHCWKDYSDRPEIWILLGPLIVALLVNLLFLINIMKILLTKARRTDTTTDSIQFRRAIKATIVLFPLLGINNLLFSYNPGGEFNKIYVILNTTFGSTQGFFVAILYCFICKDVKDALRREYWRFSVRRNANLEARRQTIRNNGREENATADDPV